MAKKSKKGKPENTTPSVFKSKEKLVAIGASIFVIIIALVGLVYLRENPLDNPLGSLNLSPNEKVLKILRENERVIDVEELKGLVGSNNETYLELFVERGAHFKPGVPLFKVGSETITSDDINIYFYTNEQATLISKSNLSDQQILNAIEEVKKSSILYQVLASDNEPYKGAMFIDTNRTADLYQIRAVNVSEMRSEFQKEHVNSVKGEKVTMWWYNNALKPSIGVDEARAVTEKKMNAIHADLLSGKITMDQAATQIQNDLDHYSIDAAAMSNAYYVFNSEEGMDIFQDPELNDALFTLGEGEYSEVLVGKDYDGSKWYPAYYTIIYVSEVSGDGLTLDQLYVNSLPKYSFEVITNE